MSRPQGGGDWCWAVALGIPGKAHTARSKTQESRLPGPLPSPRRVQGREGQAGGFGRLWAGEGLSGIKKHKFFLRFCCSPHRKRTVLDFKRVTSFFSYLHSPVCFYSPLEIADVC